MYGSYGGAYTRPQPIQGGVAEAVSTVDFSPETTQGAALSVAVMLVGCVLILTVLKKSGFRAMVAVGHGG